LDEFNGIKSSNLTTTTTNNKLAVTPSQNRLIASPNLQSKFSPSVTISKSPSMSKRNISTTENESKSLLNKFALNKSGADSKSVLNKYTGAGAKDEENKDVDENVEARNIPVNRKNRNNLKNIEEVPKNNLQITVTKPNYNDLPITGALKQTKKKTVDFKVIKDDDSQQ